MTAFMTYKEECESLRQQLADMTAYADKRNGQALDLAQQLAEANAEIASLKGSHERSVNLRQQLAASQAREQQLREALSAFAYRFPESAVASEAIALHADTTALSAIVTRAGEVMRNNCVEWVRKNIRHRDGQAYIAIEIRALPGVTLEDIKLPTG